MTSVEIRPDFKRLQKWLEEILPDEKARRRLMIKATAELADRARVYPAPGPWNSEPGTRGRGIWYQRLWGTRWRDRSGMLAGKNNSQQLQRSWKIEISPDAYQSEVFTAVTYAPFLMDETQRAPWAAAHGWQTVDEIAQDYSGRFVDIVEAAIDEQIKKPV